MTLNEKLTEYVWNEMNKFVYEQPYRDRNFVHVSQLVKYFYPETFKNLKQNKEQKTLNFFTGICLHEFRISQTMNEVSLCADIVNETPWYNDSPDFSRRYDFLYGTYDDRIEIDGVPVLIDKKTTAYLPKEPPAYYKMQLNFYNMLNNIVNEENIDMGAIIYFDVNKKFKPTVYSFALDSYATTRRTALECMQKLENELETPTI